jgi:hypothetical protein
MAFISCTQVSKAIVDRGTGQFTASPSYQFALQQGLQAQQRQATATGRLGSGAHLKDATQYAKDMASTEYQNFLNRWYQSLTPWQSLANQGQTATTNIGGGAADAAKLQQMNALYSGQAQAANYINQANIGANALSGGANTYLQYNALRNLYPQGVQTYQPYSTYQPYRPNEGIF